MSRSTGLSLRRSFLLFVLVCAAAGCSSAGTRAGGPARGPAAGVPARFAPLYSELDLQLAAAQTTALELPGAGQACPVMAPSLYPASSYFGPAEPGSDRWKDLMTALDGFQALGVNAVSLMVSFPDLTAEVKDPEPLLKSYGALAAELRARKMKLLVEHFVYPPWAPTREGKFVAGIKALPDPEGAFLDYKKKEINLILSRIKPDYLTIVTEPGTCDKFLGVSVSTEDYVQWLNGLLAELSASGAKGGTKLGAGAGAWEPERYVSAFTKIKGLDYVDIHFYPMKLGPEDLFAKFLRLADQIKADDPSKELVVSETWLYKHGADEPKGVFSAEAYGRNGYDFWAPLDARFLELINTVGKKKGLAVIAPYFPQFFFTAGKFDPAVAPDWPAGMTEEWRLALGAAGRGAVSPTGKAFGEMLGRCKN